MATSRDLSEGGIYGFYASYIMIIQVCLITIRVTICWEKSDRSHYALPEFSDPDIPKFIGNKAYNLQKAGTLRYTPAKSYTAYLIVRCGRGARCSSALCETIVSGVFYYSVYLR